MATTSPFNSNPNSRAQSTSGRGPANTSSSSVRPRNRRLVSTELQEHGSLSSSRDQSPTPDTSSNRIARQSSSSTLRERAAWAPSAVGAGSQTSSSGLGKGLMQAGWTSWSAIQGLASSVLNGDLMEREDDGVGGSRLGRPKTRGPKNWGPEGLPKQPRDAIGAGTLDARRAEVRARRAKDVLQSHEGVNGGLDINGNYKRRNSSETRHEEEEEPDALVYLHHVKPQDTVAGVVLKYNCQPAVFKKANGLWSNDAIQMRNVVFLPVDACSVRGRPCDPKGGKPIDLLAPTPEIEEGPSNGQDTNGDPWGNSQSVVSESAVEEEQPWTHVRWVSFSPTSDPVEIVRLPRKSLGYFPPRRRKSTVTGSSISTPRSSFDTTALQSEAQPGSRAGTPNRHRGTNDSRMSDTSTGSYFPPFQPTTPPSTRPKRSESLGDTAGMPRWMRGPGGVGTMDRSVRLPGPAPDSLNKWAKKHVPGLAGDEIPSISVLGSDMAKFGFSTQDFDRLVERVGSGSATPTSANQSGLGLENAAAAIETWVRRLAIKGPSTPRASPGKPGVSREPEGDLIELLDGAGSDDGRTTFTSTGDLLTIDQPRSIVEQMTTSTSGRREGEGVRGRFGPGGKGKKSD